MGVSTERVEGTVLVVRMDREVKRNAVDRDLALAIDEALNDLEDDPTLRVGVLTGTPRVFSAGTDMYDPRDKVTDRGGEYGVIRRDRAKPLIAAVEGPAVGGGFEIALACDLIVAADDATFALPEPRRGLIATSGALFRAPRSLPLNVAREMLLTGAPMSADRAYQLGVANLVTAPGGAVDAALTVARDIVACAPMAIEQTMLALRQMAAEDEARGWAATAQAKAVIVASADAAEGRAAFAERRDPRWAGR